MSVLHALVSVCLFDCMVKPHCFFQVRSYFRTGLRLKSGNLINEYGSDDWVNKQCLISCK